jgi:hypothetical protein
VELTEEVISPKPGYCAQAKQIVRGDNRPFCDQKIETAEARLAGLSRGLHHEAELLACGGRSSLPASPPDLGEAQCLAAKVKVTRNLLVSRAKQAVYTLKHCLNKTINASLS